MIDPTLFNRKSLRRALKDWHDVAALDAHPLANLPLVGGQGVVIRQLLQQALSELKPVGETADFSQSRWRYFYLVQEQFVNGRRAKTIRDEMGVSESGYFVDQRQALDWLGSKLREWAETTTVPASTAASLRLLTGLPVQLPAQPTRFIGREAERTRLSAQLARLDCRLLSLVGPGGMGKTRLAVQIATEQQRAFAAGVCFVPLAPLETADLVPTTIAKSLGLTFAQPEAMTQQLINFLREKELLLVLDNFEHVMGALALVGDILTQTAKVKLLVTSRERLHLRGEWVTLMTGLTFPNGRVASDWQPDDWQAYDAMQLFGETVGRAGAPLAEEDWSSVAHICGLVQGHPLALGLAASWVPVLSCAEIAAEIEENLDFLATTFQDLPARHQSLRAVFQHSWRLLTVEEQRVFARLSVFRGSFTREAAQVVAGASLVVLQHLVHKSLLVVSASRYSIHALLRQFAAEALANLSEEATIAQAAHAAYYLEKLAGQTSRLQQGRRQKEVLAAIDQEMEEIRTAWQQAVSQRETELVLGAIRPLYLVYIMHNRWREGLRMFGRVQKMWRSDEEVIEARCIGLALAFRGRFLFKLGDFAGARAAFATGLAILEPIATAEELAWASLLAIQANLPAPHLPERLFERCLELFAEDAWGEARARYELGALIYSADTARTEDAQRLMTQSLARFEAIGAEWGEAACWHHLGHISLGLGQYAEALRRTEQSLSLFEAIGDYIGVAAALGSLGQIAGTEGAYADAQAYYQRCLLLRREYGNRKLIAECLDSLGYIMYLQGKDAEAEQHYEESLRLSQAIKDQHGVAWSLHNLGDIARRRRDFEWARALYDESQQLHKLLDEQAWGRVVAMEKLGQVFFGLGQVAAAKSWLLEALQIGLHTQQLRTAVDALWSISQILLDEDEQQLAQGVLHLIVHHHATAQEVRNLARAALGELEVQEGETAALTLAEAAVLLQQLWARDGFIGL